MGTRTDSLVWARAAVVSSVAFLLGAVGHVSAGGLLPSWLVLASMLVISTPLCAVALAKPASTRRVVALVVSGQAACHVLLSVSAGHGGDRSGSRPVAGTGPLPAPDAPHVDLVHHHDGAESGTPLAAGTSGLPDAAVVLDHVPMFMAHIAVAVLVGCWVAVGERTLWALLAMAFTPVLAWSLLPGTPVLPARRGIAIRRRPATLPSLARATRCVVRRGPPALLAV